MLDDKIPKSSIINIASIIGKTGNVGQCNYAASKAGVEAFTRSVSKELAKLVDCCQSDIKYLEITSSVFSHYNKAQYKM